MMTPAKVVEQCRGCAHARPLRDQCVGPVELRRICEVELLRPPTREESVECLAAWMNGDPRWAQAFLLLARVDRQRYLNSLWYRLWAFDPEDVDVIGRAAQRARIESPDGPEPLVLTVAGWPSDGCGRRLRRVFRIRRRRDDPRPRTEAFEAGSVIVADLAGGTWSRFHRRPARRTPARRRPWWRWWL